MRRRPVRWFATRTLLYANGARSLAGTGHQHHDAFLPLRASFVIGVLLTGIMNALFIVGFSVPRHMAYGRLLFVKRCPGHANGGDCAGESVCSGTTHAQDNRGMTLYFIWMTKLEWGIGAVVLAIVSLFATLNLSD